MEVSRKASCKSEAGGPEEEGPTGLPRREGGEGPGQAVLWFRGTQPVSLGALHWLCWVPGAPLLGQDRHLTSQALCLT